MSREDIINDLNKLNLASNPDFVKKTIMEALTEGKVEMEVPELEGILPQDTFDVIKFDAEYGMGKRRQEEYPGLPLTYMFRKYYGASKPDYEILDDNMLDTDRHGVTIVGNMKDVKTDAFIEQAIKAVKRDLDKGLSFHKGPQDDILEAALEALSRINVKDISAHLIGNIEKLPNMTEEQAKNALLEFLSLTGVRLNIDDLSKVVDAEYMENYSNFFQDEIDELADARISEEGNVSPEREAEIRDAVKSELTDAIVENDEYGDFVFSRIANPEDQILFDQEDISLNSLADMTHGAIENGKEGKFTNKLLESQTIQAILDRMPNLLELGGHSLQESFVPRDIAEEAGKRTVGMNDVKRAAETITQSKEQLLGRNEQENKENKDDLARNDEDGVR